MTRHIERLQELTEISRVAASLGDATGRYARTPDYTRAASPSSRPQSDRGSTFHFSHKAKSKSNDISDTNATHTTSAAHQGYIERPSATEEISSELVKSLRAHPMPDIEEELIADGFHYPERIVDPYRASFGTLGKTKAERKAFWNDVERFEPKRARVQSRIIAEIPVEFTLEERCAAVRDFCQTLEERGLPYWATIHAPGKRNDKRNYHLHITYFERPSGRREDGTWSHVATEVRKKKSRHTYTTRPYLSNRHPDTRKRGWVKYLRGEYSDACNFYLSNSASQKRFDPRSYKDSGIEKEPTEHLGNKVSAIESMGVDTEAGQRNSKREIRWRVQQAEEPWVLRARRLRLSDAYDEPSLADRRLELVALAESGITSARKSVSMTIISDLLTHRAEQRDTFLEMEINRLSQKDDLSDLAQRTSRIIALSAERDALSDRLPELVLTANKCRKIGIGEKVQSQKLMARFDQAMGMFDPDAVLADQQSHRLDSIEEIFPGDEPREELTAAELESIDDLFGPDPIAKPETKTNEDTEMQILNITDKAEDEEKPKPKKEEPKKVSPELTILEIIQRATKEAEGATEKAAAENVAADAFPEAWAIQPSREKKEVMDLDRKLASMNNKQLRLAAIATRDATDLCPQGALREDFNRGWSVLRYEAGRRGLDLDTGKHTPEAATDPDRATLHRDEDQCPIRVVRKNIIAQRVRA